MIRLFLALAVLCLSAAAQVRFEDILKSPGEGWLTYSGSYNGWRYAPGRQITPQNAGSLVPKWVYHVPDARAMQMTPLVHDGVMYVTNSNNVYALDARTGRLIWKYSDVRAARQGTNRGVGILGDRVYFTSADNYLTALDRRSGAVVFAKQFADLSTGVTSSAPVFIARDKVIVGSSGSDSGIRGYIMALSASTGDELWRTYTIPAKGEPGSETWRGDFLEWGGAGAWLSGTYDPDLNTIYWTTGNAWPDFNGVWREGDNLYTSSLLALDLDTGKKKWHFQFTPHDTHDWDAQSWPVLLDMDWQGRPRKVVLHANRNGFFYMLDRVTGEFLRASDDDGNLLALEAKTGKHLWNFNVGERLTASPIIYELDGKQYVAIASAQAIFNFGRFEPVKSVPLPKITIQK